MGFLEALAFEILVWDGFITRPTAKKPSDGWLEKFLLQLLVFDFQLLLSQPVFEGSHFFSAYQNIIIIRIFKLYLQATV